MTVTIDGKVIPAEIRLLGGVEYLRAPTVGQREPGKSWISTQVSPTKSNLDTLASPGSTPTNVAATLRLFGQSDNAVTSIGPSTIDGVPVEDYSVRPGPATIEAEMAKAADLPSWTRAIVAQFVNGLSAKVSIDDQGLVRLVDMTMAVSTGPTTATMAVHARALGLRNDEGRRHRAHTGPGRHSRPVGPHVVVDDIGFAGQRAYCLDLKSAD